MKKLVPLAVLLSLLLTLVSVSLVSAGDTPPPPCDCGCTYTLGYWKNHPDAWPMGDRWFFDSGMRMSAVLRTPPRGDKYYILAHQFIAAWLNKRNGAWGLGCVDPDARRAFRNARKLFAGDLVKDRAYWIHLSEILDDYNNGHKGPEHCD